MAVTSSEKIVINVSAEGSGEKPSSKLETSVSFPGGRTFLLHAPDSSWINLGALEFDLFWPKAAPTNALVLVHLKDWDYFWYQNLLPGYVVPGKENHFRVDLSPSASSWKAGGHYGSWHLRALMEPKDFAIRVVCDGPYEGTCRLDKVFGIARKDDRQPFISNVRANTNRVPCFEKFELTFGLPDRYPDPFDADQVSVTADFETPSGETVRIDGFYGHNYYRKIDATGERFFLQGPPFWRVRFTPVKQGTYRYTINVRDKHGKARWGPASFTVIAPKSPGFVRVSKADPRYFEFDDGSAFFPIGHNIRSPFDTRLNDQFPWIQRWPEGSTAYARYFKAMREHGENLTEIWSAAWSLGLEWSPRQRGYHGIGQFNMIHAWEMDRVVEEADRNNIYFMLVVHNHGKFSLHWDPEWKDNPFNVVIGGYLKAPEEYFADPRALKAFRKLMRYMIARWGYSTRIFAWQLWSELDLTGSHRDFRPLPEKIYKQPEAVDWHRMMGIAIKDMDPNDHMICTHVCQDYSHQNTDIISLPEMDLCPIDGYHGSADPIYIVNVMRKTAEFNNPFKKPVLITEFGGSPWGAGVDHLEDTLHAALWASMCTSLGGTPLFWWWQLIEEENFYPKYRALSRFMNGEDMRDPDMKMHTPKLLSNGRHPKDLAVQCLKSPTRAFGWIYHSKGFEKIDPLDEPTVKNLVLRIKNMSNGNFHAEFWNTIAGTPVTKIHASSENGVLDLKVPAFTRDIAFKIKVEQ